MKTGFIGIGSLGSSIAANLMASGHELYIYNRTRAKTAALAAKGAIVCDSIAALANDCPVVFSIVSDDAALNMVTTEMVKHLAPGSIHVSISTILPQTATELAALHSARQQLYVAAPVFGRPDAAAARKLNFAMAGDTSAKEQIEPLLKDAGAAGIFDFGTEPAAANTIKLCGNFLIAAAMEAIGESIRLATGSGVDATQMWNMFSQTLFNTPLYHNYSKIILDNKFEPAAFTAKLGLKDMKLVLQQAGATGQSMPLAGLLQTNLQQLVNNGHENTDWSAVANGGI